MMTTKDLRIYRFLYRLVYIILRPFYWIRYRGLENIPEGPVVICGNHSSWIDPFFIGLALKKDVLHMMAKMELFKNPIVRYLLKKVGAFSVDRSGADITAIKTAVRYLKNGEKIGIFPEGTRAKNDGDVEAKQGAIRIAEMTKAPILPVYIPRVKKIFRRFTVVFGEAYEIPKSRDRGEERYRALSAELMDRINSLKVEE